MTALLSFQENGKKISEGLFLDKTENLKKEIFKEMVNMTGNVLLVSSDGKRMTKGKIPKFIKGSLSWIK